MWMWPQIDVEFLGRFGYDCPGDLERAVEGMSFSETSAYFKERFSLPMTLEIISDLQSLDDCVHNGPSIAGGDACGDPLVLTVTEELQGAGL